MTDWGYTTVNPPAEFVILTVIPRADEPEYREYTISSDELPRFLREKKQEGTYVEQVIDIRAIDTTSDATEMCE
jgi:hypothetical protein